MASILIFINMALVLHTIALEKFVIGFIFFRLIFIAFGAMSALQAGVSCSDTKVVTSIISICLFLSSASLGVAPLSFSACFVEPF